MTVYVTSWIDGDELQDELVVATGGVALTRDPVTVGEMAPVTVTVASCPGFPEPGIHDAPGEGNEPGPIVTVAVCGVGKPASDPRVNVTVVIAPLAADEPTSGDPDRGIVIVSIVLGSQLDPEPVTPLDGAGTGMVVVMTDC